MKDNKEKQIEEIRQLCQSVIDLIDKSDNIEPDYLLELIMNTAKIKAMNSISISNIDKDFINSISRPFYNTSALSNDEEILTRDKQDKLLNIKKIGESLDRHTEPEDKINNIVGMSFSDIKEISDYFDGYKVMVMVNNDRCMTMHKYNIKTKEEEIIKLIYELNKSTKKVKINGIIRQDSNFIRFDIYRNGRLII